MTRPCRPNRPAPLRWPLLAAAVTVLLAACGGSGEETASPGAASAAAAADDDVADRRFTLGTQPAIAAAQREIDPSLQPGELRLIVRLNPAAVSIHQRMAMLGSAGRGESADVAALRERQIAAKVQAVSATVQSVLSKSVLAAAPGARLGAQFSHALEGFVLTLPAAEAQAVAEALARNPAVDGVEPERVYRVGQASPGTRTLDSRAWGVDRIDQRGNTLDGLCRQTLNGSGVNVYVVDSGISPHNEFGSRLAAGYSAINDGRGTIDCHGHGTHVAGTAAGSTFGVAPGATVVPVRVMNCTGSSAGSSLMMGLDWLAAQGKRPGVINLSLGGDPSDALDAALQRLMTLGFTVVAAAGNDNIDACLQSPGRAAGAITVAASDRSDVKASFSNWGSCVALWAPGTAISSAGHLSPTAVVAMNGTSMAAPHAAGAAALLLQATPTLAPAALRQQLLAQASADRVSAVPGSMTRALLYAGMDGTDGAASPTPSTPSTPATPATPSTPSTPAVATHVVVQSLTMSTEVPKLGSWQALAVVTVVDNLGKPVSGAQVTGRFSNSSKAVGCTTAGDGRCSIASANLNWATVPALGMAITQMKTVGIPWNGGGAVNAQVARPEAPQARIAALSGTMFRAKSTSANWVPQFVVTLVDGKGAPVVGAKVQGTMQVMSGARAAALKTLTCTTAASGQCTLAWNGQKLDATHTGATLTIDSVTRDFLTYRPGAVTGATVGVVR